MHTNIMTLKNQLAKNPGATGQHIKPIAAERLNRAKAAYTTRGMDLNDISTLITGDVTPQPGDLTLARVDKIGQHARLELGTGRRAPLFIGDEVVVCYGHRYAPDQFEGEVPNSLEPCHLVAAGGIAALALSRHSKKKQATRITPLGLLGDCEGRALNLADWSLPPITAKRTRPLTLVSVGTAMNAGKTTTAAYLIKGLMHAGMNVGAAKLTGTGAGGDTWLMRDAGASEVYDFTDAGFASTYKATLPELEEIFLRLTGHLQNAGVDAIVLEVADGLFQEETAALLESPLFRNSIDGVLFAAGDAMGASIGVDWLRKKHLPVFATSGTLTASPLACREAERATGLPALNLDRLSNKRISSEIYQWLGLNGSSAIKVLQ